MPLCVVVDVEGRSGVPWKCKQGVLSVSVVSNAGSALSFCAHTSISVFSIVVKPNLDCNSYYCVLS